jgi:transcription factor SFP1
MSISPPHWAPGKAPWGTSGSYVGSLGAMGASFGRERDRELEAKYVKDFSCCARQLNGLHELLEQ